MITINEITAIVGAILAIFGLIVGYIKYKKTRFSESKLELQVSPLVFKGNSGFVVKISIHISNKGSTVVKASENDCVFDLKIIPETIKNEFELYKIEKLKSICDRPIHFLNEVYGPSDMAKPYLIEPGITDIVQLIFYIKYQGLLVVDLVFKDKQNYKWSTREVISTEDLAEDLRPTTLKDAET